MALKTAAILKILYYFLMAASLSALLLNRRHLDKRLLLFGPLLMLAIVTNGLQDIAKKHWLSDFVFAIYTPIEYIMLTYIINSYLKSKIVKKIIYLSMPLFFFSWVVVQIWIKPLGSFYEYMDVIIESPLLCTWTLFYFFQITNDSEDIFPNQNPMFWASIGNLFFYPISATSYGFGAYFEHIGNKSYSDILYWIARSTNLILYFFYLIAFSRIWTLKRF